jgi:hypothetical protein
MEGENMTTRYQIITEWADGFRQTFGADDRIDAITTADDYASMSDMRYVVVRDRHIAGAAGIMYQPRVRRPAQRRVVRPVLA